MKRDDLIGQLYLEGKTESQVIERLFLAAIINHVPIEIMGKVIKAYTDMRDLWRST
jgi:hypothetical protein